MPSTTPRGYPYPLDSDPIDVANDIRRLAQSINNDVGTVAAGGSNNAGSITSLQAQINAEVTNRVNGDNAIRINAWLGGSNRSDNIVILGAYGEAATDGFALIFVPYPFPIGWMQFSVDHADSNVGFSCHPLPLISNNNGAFFSVRWPDGSSAVGVSLGYSFLGVGYRL